MKRSAAATPPSSRKKARISISKRRTDYQYRKGFETIIPRFPKSVFPYQKWATLKYCESYITLNPAIGSSTSYVFRCNDVYDPNVTAAGHQPTGFDQYMAMYNKFVVYASKIKATGFSPDTETLDTCGGIAILDAAATTATTENYLEQPLTDWKVIPGGAGAQPQSFNTAFNTKDFSGTDPKDNDLLHGSAASAPGKLWYYHVFVGPTNSTDDPGTIKFSVEIEYLVKFFEPKTQTVS